MKTKKRIFLLAFSALIFGNVYVLNAQVTIGGETEPVKGATLDLSPEKGYVGGLKLPNVELTSLTAIPESFTDAGSVTPASLKGLQVYNTTTNAGKGLAEGVYTWNGSRWVQAAMNGNLVYNCTWNSIKLAAGVETEILSFTLAPGTYMWSLNMPIQYDDTNLNIKACSFYLRNKDTANELAQIRNHADLSEHMFVTGCFIFTINTTTTIALSVNSFKAGSTRSDLATRFCQIVKLN